MASIRFYSIKEDNIEIVRFIFENTDFRFFIGDPINILNANEIRSLKQFIITKSSLISCKVNCEFINFQLWSPSIMKDIQAIGLAQLYLKGVIDDTIIQSDFGHNSFERASKWDDPSKINWDIMKKYSNKIIYHIRKRIGSGTIRGCVVLPNAKKLIDKDYKLKQIYNNPFYYKKDGSIVFEDKK